MGPLALLAVIHETAHRITAKLNQVELDKPIPLVSPFIGYLGSLTSYKSFPPNRRALFDIAASGPLIGSLASYLLLAIGLTLTAITPVMSIWPRLPLTLLDQSVLVANLINYMLPGAFASVDPANASLAVHPLVLAGYWGVIFNALDLIPLGRLDGARMLEALIGRRTAAVTSSLTGFAILIGSLLMGQVLNPLLFTAGVSKKSSWWWWGGWL